MSDAVKLSARLPGDPETNGLDDLQDVLIEEPDLIRVALVWFDVAKVTHDVDADTDIPTVRIRRVEPLGTTDNIAESIRDAVQAIMKDRLGRTPLDFASVEFSAEGSDPSQITTDEMLSVVDGGQ